MRYGFRLQGCTGCAPVIFGDMLKSQISFTAIPVSNGYRVTTSNTNIADMKLRNVEANYATLDEVKTAAKAFMDGVVDPSA